MMKYNEKNLEDKHTDTAFNLNFPLLSCTIYTYIQNKCYLMFNSTE